MRVREVYPRENFGDFREERRELAAGVDKPERRGKLGQVIERGERRRDVPGIVSLGGWNDGHKGDCLARRHPAVRRMTTPRQLLISGRPAGERIGELAPPVPRLARRQAARRVPDTNDAMRRRGAKAWRQAVGPAIEHFPPRPLAQLFAEERAPIGEPTTLAERAAPVLAANASTSPRPGQHPLAVARDPRHHSFGVTHCTQRLSHHRRVIAVAVSQLDPIRRKDLESVVQ